MEFPDSGHGDGRCPTKSCHSLHARRDKMQLLRRCLWNLGRARISLSIGRREVLTCPRVQRFRYASGTGAAGVTDREGLVSCAVFTDNEVVLHSCFNQPDKGETAMKRTMKALLVISAIACTGPVFAQQQSSTGLGSAWPTDARDVSRMPGFHAYAWVKSGVEYVQVNDTAGNVLIAVATANGVFLPLPMGRNAMSLKTLPAGTTSTTPVTGVTVYRDSSVLITATPQSNGVLQFTAASTCTNPVECTTHIN